MLLVLLQQSMTFCFFLFASQRLFQIINCFISLRWFQFVLLKCFWFSKVPVIQVVKSFYSAALNHMLSCLIVAHIWHVCISYMFWDRIHIHCQRLKMPIMIMKVFLGFLKHKWHFSCIFLFFSMLLLRKIMDFSMAF